METKLPTRSDYHTNASLYTVYDFEANEAELIFDTLFSTLSIECFCIECRRDSVFVPEINLPTDQYDTPVSYLGWWAGLRPYLVRKKFHCSRSQKHSLFTLSLVTKTTLVKIAQHPTRTALLEVKKNLSMPSKDD